MLILLLIGVFLIKLKKENYTFNPFKLIGQISVFVLAASAFFEYNYLVNCFNIRNSFYFNEGLVFDNFSYILTILVYMLGSILCWLSLEYFKHDITYNNFEYFMLIILSLLGIVLLLNSSNLLMAYLGLELQSLPFYVLAAFRRYNRESTEAGLKYFILGGFSSALYLFGSSIVYGLTGTLDLITISLIFEDLLSVDKNLFVGILVGFTFILSAIFFKLSVFPFHTWTPDVYSGSILPVVGLFATASKIGVFCFLTRLVLNVFSFYDSYFSIVFTVSGLASIIIGTFSAMYQINIKRLLAYSTIAHMGYVMLALSTVDLNGVINASIYIIFYIIINTLIFTLLIVFQKQGENKIFIETVHDLSSIKHSNNSISVLISILFLSLAGIPPLLGFFSKYLVILNLINNSMYFSAFITVILSGIAAYYYLRLVRFVLFLPTTKYDVKHHDLTVVSTIFISIAFLINISIILFIDDIFNYFTLILS
jgi:NADH-quinone oxidoreductase subunit N